MKREEKFLISHAPYAVKLDDFRVIEKSWSPEQPPYYSMSIPAVWFRRKDGVLTAHLGTVWDSSRDKPTEVNEWLTNMWDGRYGGNCQARWDGESLWAPETTWDRMVEDQEFLSGMLDAFPAVPAGYDGWWTYKR